MGQSEWDGADQCAGADQPDAGVYAGGFADIGFGGGGIERFFHDYDCGFGRIRFGGCVVGIGPADGRNGHVQSDFDCCAGIGKFYGYFGCGVEHHDWNLYDYGDGNGRRHYAHGNDLADRNICTGSGIYADCFAHFGFSGAGRERRLNDHDCCLRWVQFGDCAVGNGHAYGRYGNVQSNVDCCAGFGDVFVDAGGGLDHDGGDLSDYRNRHRRRNHAYGDGFADGDGGDGGRVHHFGFAHIRVA